MWLSSILSLSRETKLVSTFYDIVSDSSLIKRPYYEKNEAEEENFNSRSI